MGSLSQKRRNRRRKKKQQKLPKEARWQRRQQGK